jgi:flagellin-like hook-associated protein FlgL
VQIAESSMLSILRDADLTETITRYTQLMQQLEASMRLAGSNLQTSLLDFLR